MEMVSEPWMTLILNSVKSIEDLSKEIEIDLTEDEKIEIKTKLPLRITSYYLNLIKKNPILRKMVIPSSNELIFSSDESIDPLNEDEYKKSTCIVHKYPNRVLFLTTNKCASYCRYCTRSRIVGNKNNFSKKDWNEAIDYITKTPQIIDVLLSGGDFLMLSNSNIEYLLNKLSNIPHVEIIRVGTKMPVYLPQRIDNDLIKILKKYRPYINIHISHPAEITLEFIDACNKLSIDANCILGSQTVLLKDINDDALVLQELFNKLLKNRVTPYYLYQMDKIDGCEHFRCDLDKMIDIMHSLISWNSGRSIPEFVIDTEIGKIPLRLDYVKKGENGKYILTSFEKNKSIEY